MRLPGLAFRGSTHALRTSMIWRTIVTPLGIISMILGVKYFIWLHANSKSHMDDPHHIRKVSFMENNLHSAYR